MKINRPISDSQNKMNISKKPQFESEVYSKLKAAEQDARVTKRRYTSKDVLQAMQDAIGSGSSV